MDRGLMDREVELIVYQSFMQKTPGKYFQASFAYFIINQPVTLYGQSRRPHSVLPSSPNAPPPFSPARRRIPQQRPRWSLLLSRSSVKCKLLKYNLLSKRGVLVFDTPLLSNPLKISTLHFTANVITWHDGKVSMVITTLLRHCWRKAWRPSRRYL